MKNRIFALCVSILMSVMSFSVFAEGDYYRLQDMTEPALLSETENAEILAMLDKASEKHGMDIVILTVPEVEEGLTVEEDATEWYEYLGFGEDGVMLYISMEERDWYLLTSGFGITAITDAGIEYISEKFLPALSDGDYVTAFNTFITYTDEFITQAKTGKPYDVGNMPKEPYSLPMSLLVSVGIGLLVSLIITSIWKGQLKSVAFQTHATSYLKPGSLSIANSRDFFLYRTIDRVEKKNDSDGGSSTHKSSSGKNYGGGGGKF
ncbi:MAG: TPM domain-containing protein [Ruminococcaceae bacterium]|nr:TPM domain-containing protein [Oscillospiraceae bacterium]